MTKKAKQQDPQIKVTELVDDEFHGQGGAFMLVDGKRVRAEPAAKPPLTPDEEAALADSAGGNGEATE